MKEYVSPAMQVFHFPVENVLAYSYGGGIETPVVPFNLKLPKVDLSKD